MRSAQRERDQPLLGAVVQVALEAPAFGVARRDDPLPRGLHLLQTGADLVGEPLVVERKPGGRRHRVAAVGLLAQGGVVDERAEQRAVALELGRGELVAGRRELGSAPSASR